MKNLLMILIAMGSLGLASAQSSGASKVDTLITAADKAKINTEAQEYTGRACSGKADEYFMSHTKPDISIEKMSGMYQSFINSQFDQMVADVTKSGAEVRKVSPVPGGKRAYIYHKKQKRGLYILMQISGSSFIAHGCGTK